MNSNEIRTKVLQVLMEENVFPDIAQMDIQEDDHLEAYGMDSLAFIKMIVRIEEVFEIEVPNDLLVFSKWSTFRQIVECLMEIIK